MVVCRYHPARRLPVRGAPLRLKAPYQRPPKSYPHLTAKDIGSLHTVNLVGPGDRCSSHATLVTCAPATWARVLSRQSSPTGATSRPMCVTASGLPVRLRRLDQLVVRNYGHVVQIVHECRFVALV